MGSDRLRDRLFNRKRPHPVSRALGVVHDGQSLLELDADAAQREPVLSSDVGARDSAGGQSLALQSNARALKRRLLDRIR